MIRFSYVLLSNLCGPTRAIRSIRSSYSTISPFLCFVCTKLRIENPFSTLAVLGGIVMTAWRFAYFQDTTNMICKSFLVISYVDFYIYLRFSQPVCFFNCAEYIIVLISFKFFQRISWKSCRKYDDDWSLWSDTLNKESTVLVTPSKVEDFSVL